MDRAGPARLKTVESPLQKYPEACVWQPTSNLLVFFVEYTFMVSRPNELGDLNSSQLRRQAYFAEDQTSVLLHQRCQNLGASVSFRAG